MNIQEYIRQEERATNRVNRLLKVIPLGDGSKVVLPKTPNDPQPHPRKGYYEEREAFIKDFWAKEGSGCYDLDSSP
ncbi:MAG TPA: hypothetical protein VGQ59_08175 [Cyclobacteriaceae bacterium]|nr:hypothetical protein [Cyclobacteriaceae bacterium]